MSVLSTMPPRKLRIFAFDPSMGRRHETLPLNEVIVSIPWEMDKLDPGVPFVGPVGEYVEVVDFDPSLDLVYRPVNLHDPSLLADNGLRPAEWNPQFHQQMTYAVAMNTIVNFESALGRVALWAPRDRDEKGRWIDPQYVQRLRIYPHALRDANAYYSPEKKALLFGYFAAGEGQSGAPAGTVIFTCLSHDIIAHETSHALLDGMHPRFSEATNPDVLALHEAFADIVAIFQHFSYPDVLKDQIARTRGDLESQNLLGQLAQEFGQVLGRGTALRDALGGWKDGVWRAHEPNPKLLRETEEVHDRGAILVAAVFRAFLSIYRARISDLLRIASSGTGILPAGALHPDLVNRLAKEASKSARHILQMCIRALDYCPPVDVTFGDYLRAIITADRDLYPEDEHNYRVAVMEAFLAWGIVPRDMPIVSVQTLLWPTMGEAAADYKAAFPSLSDLKGDVAYLLSRPLEMIDELKSRSDFHDSEGQKFLDGLDRTAQEIFNELTKAMGNRLPQTAKRSRSSLREILGRNLLELGLEADRKVEWLARDLYGRLFWGLITETKNAPLRDIIRIRTDADAPATVRRSRIVNGPAIEVHSVRMAARRGNRDQIEREYVVELTQTRQGYLDPKKQEAADKGKPPKGPHDFYFRRGCTLLIDAETFEIRRVIRTPGDICDDAELERMRAHLTRQAQRRENAFTGSASKPVRPEIFAHLHRQGS